MTNRGWMDSSFSVKQCPVKDLIMPTNDNCRKLGKLYRDSLVEDVIPFWQRHSLDKEHGGYFTCLDRQGNVFDTDKFVWLQARQVWTFSRLYNCLEKRTEWLDIARHGVEFLQKHGRDEKGNWYYGLDKTGRPLFQPFSIFSDGFAAMAFSQYALASGEEKSKQIAEQSYNNYLRRRNSPKGHFSKSVAGTRPMLPLSIRMIHLNMLLEMEWQLDKPQVELHAMQCLDEVMRLFLDVKHNFLFENVSPDGSHPDCFEGRVINPGHGLEVLWLVMATAKRWGKTELIEKAASAVVSTMEYGWDREYGGIIYRKDLLGKPLLQIEWDQKMWWCHAEALIALAMAYKLTGNIQCLEWLNRLHDYTWERFVDPDYGEWFGYLNRRGGILLDLKGGRWKGCFHVPRSLYMASEWLFP